MLSSTWPSGEITESNAQARRESLRQRFATLSQRVYPCIHFHALFVGGLHHEAERVESRCSAAASFDDYFYHSSIKLEMDADYYREYCNSVPKDQKGAHMGAHEIYLAQEFLALHILEFIAVQRARRNGAARM